MSTLQEIRDAVRTQLDLDSDDLTDTTADLHIREGFDRTFALEQRWPFFQTSWDLNLADTDVTLTVPSDVAAIERLRDTGKNLNLVMIGQQFAEENFQGVQSAATEPTLFSIWGDTITLWPVPTLKARTYQLRGYRKPTWSGVAATELDGDERLHSAIFHYACALAYAQLEDPELEAVYMQRWGAHVEAVRRDLMRPQHHIPLVLNGGLYGHSSLQSERLILEAP